MLFAEQVTKNYTLYQGLQLYEKHASNSKLLRNKRFSQKTPELFEGTSSPTCFLN